MSGTKVLFAVTVYTACRDDAQQFRCHTTGLCVPTDVVCDGEKHCGDWSDELICGQSHTYSSLYAYAYGPADATAQSQFSVLIRVRENVCISSTNVKRRVLWISK